ncbi:uncharacterized protein LOC129616942 [Condylostylus longicornis]|uniref:uncharacterized protein LOC129616942 n=1 Tax=Condylostylus longicornis TaxID=2530218 RepID=UPI00244E1160|nr:uncharacterized protein LOC129616942 [Condylostylus longicornis]
MAAEQKKAPIMKNENDYIKNMDGFIKPESDQVILLFDYDGTLAPLTQDLSVMPKDNELNLKKLAKNEKIFMVIFSGRSLEEIKNHLKYENVTYAGNHGLEVEYPDKKKFKIEMPQELLDKHAKLVEELKEKCVLSGAWVEDKKISVSYHYKGVTEKLKTKLVEDAKALIKQHGFQLIETPHALEGKPRVNWDKEIRPMNMRKRRRIYESKEKSNLSSINSTSLQTKKRIRIFELVDVTTDESVVTYFRSHYENNYQKVFKAKTIGNDLRGKIKGSCRKSDETLVDVAKDHIKSFPHYESYYTRSNNPNRKYLSSDLNLRKMFNLCVEKKDRHGLLLQGHTSKEGGVLIAVKNSLSASNIDMRNHF